MRIFGWICKGTDGSELRIQREQFGCGFLPNVRMERVKQLIAPVLALWIIATSASANLGENSERIEDRYGTIVERRLRDDGTLSVIYTHDPSLYRLTEDSGGCIVYPKAPARKPVSDFGSPYKRSI